MTLDFTVIIPARFGSTRFPGKPLADIHGKAMIEHVVMRAREAGANEVIVATDDSRIAAVCEGVAQVCMTSSHHQSGTERIAQVIADRAINEEDIIVNVQGDEPFVPADNIRQVAELVSRYNDCAMSTLATVIESVEDVYNPNVVKVVRNTHNHALYFSRSPIPFERSRMMTSSNDANASLYLRHIGLYGYRARYVRQYVEYSPSQLEQIESLEQLRALWYGDKIVCDIAVAPPPTGIDTPQDLEKLLREIG